MDHFKRIYTTQAEAYHALIAEEDVDGNLKRRLRGLISGLPTDEPSVLDVGAGTGRITHMVGDLAETFVSLDLHAPMLIEQRNHLPAANSVLLTQADARQIPFPNETFDIAFAGWALGHMTGWYPDRFQDEIDRAISEMARVVRPDGIMCIMETLGTGATQPAPPTESLARYYRHMETSLGFQHEPISTDYQFDSPAEALDKMGFFFMTQKDPLIEKITTQGWARVPEWTGLWWLTRSSYCAT